LIIAGLGSAAFHPVGAVQATLKGRDRLQGKETTATAVFFMAGQSGHFIGPIITGIILVAMGLPGLLILAVISIPLAFSLAWQLRANHPHPEAAPLRGRLSLKAGAGFVIVLALVAAFQSWAQANMVNLMPKYLRDLGQAPTVYGAFAGLFMGGSALGNLIGGYYGDRFPKRYVIAIALACASIPIFTLSKIGWSGWLYLLVPLAGLCTGSVHSNLVILAQRVIPGGMALASGLVLGFIFSSGALGMLLTGPIAEAHGFPTVLRLTTALVVAAAPLALLLKESPGLEAEVASRLNE
jgi:FSR family fosmidomycin resistance protein-like MFS transporter